MRNLGRKRAATAHSGSAAFDHRKGAVDRHKKHHAARILDRSGRITGAELEGLSDEDKEFETARAFVRFAMEAGRLAAKAPSTQPPAAIATAAARVAARLHAPGLDFVQLAPGFRARRAIRRQSFA